MSHLAPYQSYNPVTNGGVTDEIDLFELFQSLWKEKVLIALITLVITVVALIYALASTSIYKTQAILVPPPVFSVQGYNEGRMEAFREVNIGGEKGFRGVAAKPFTADDVFKMFQRKLSSLHLRTAFFEEVYIPSLSVKEQQRSRDVLLNKFNKILTVKQGDAKNNPDLYEITGSSHLRV